MGNSDTNFFPLSRVLGKEGWDSEEGNVQETQNAIR